MSITIYSSDIYDFRDEVDRRIDDNLNIETIFGDDLFDDYDRLTQENYGYALEPRTYISVLVDQQQQINALKKAIAILMKEEEESDD